MSRARAKLPRRIQFTSTLVGLTALAIIVSGVYLVCVGAWKLLWPVRRLVSKTRTLKKRPPAV
jgi:hypothetical protein